MTASIPALTPPPASPPKVASQSHSTEKKTRPFNDVMAEAETADTNNQGKMDIKGSENVPLTSNGLHEKDSGDTVTPTRDIMQEVDSEDGAKANQLSDQDEVMAAAVTALSFHNMTPVNLAQIATGQDNATATSGVIGLSISDMPDMNGLNPFQTTATEMEDISIPRTVPEMSPRTGKEATAPATSLLAQQLQSIISGDSRGAIVVHTVLHPAPAEPLHGLTSPYLQSADNVNVAIAAQQTATLDHPVNPTADMVESLHENINKDSAGPQIDPLSDKQPQSGNKQQTGQQESNSNQHAASTTFATAAHHNGEPASQFIVTGLGTQTAASTPGHTSVTHPAPPPPGMPVPAGELVNHLVERFSVNPRLQTSKISLNLSPAELGALKIDIMVKGDAIKAHISAGNQQIQETIEKHMPRLKTVLEQQGFTVEDFQVSLDSPTSDQNDFFQQQFSSRQDSPPQPAAVMSSSSFELSLNSAEELLTGTTDSGVNLSI